MKPRYIALTLVALTAAGGAVAAMAPDGNMAGMEGMQHGGQSMMGCPMMSGGKMGERMSGGMMGGAMLPPGNEKLQLQMRAEIMQKVGEIMAKYASQVQSK